jgi:pSer/pThr/pTyr-binding forkhead associated (FHA) protein
MPLHLRVLTPGPRQGESILVRPSPFVIGRDADCHLRPSSPLVRERHCALGRRGWRAFVRNLGTGDGTFVNGEPVRGEVELHDGDYLKVGPLVFAVCLEVSEPAAPPPSPTPVVLAARSSSRAARTGSEDECGVLLVPYEDGVAPIARAGR